jgi:signal peptidase
MTALPWLRRLALAALLPLLVGGGLLWASRNGYRVYVVRTGSMVPTLHPGDLVVDRVPKGTYHAGEVITFPASGPESVVTHRIAAVQGSAIKTKGDANTTPDPWTVPRSSIEGVMIGKVRFGGYLLVYLHHPSGVASMVCAALALGLAWSLCFSEETQPATPAPLPQFFSLHAARGSIAT